MTSRILLLLLVTALVGCTQPPDDEEPPPPPPAEPCEPAFSDEFALGVMVFENPRWFRAFDEGCNTVELETGLQGGWHIEPALQAPRTAITEDLGGTLYWSVRNEDGDTVARAQFELFRSFWQSLEGGEAYWGDFLIFDRNPEALVGSQLTIECEIEFDDRSGLDDVTLTQTVDFVDEDPNTSFR